MLTLFLIGLVAFLLLAAVLAPLESLAWWVGTTEKELRPLPMANHVPSAQPSGVPARSYLVFLSGIAAVAPARVPVEERLFLDKLEARLPETTVVRTIFPYSVTNRGLTGRRRLAGLWRQLERLRLRRQVALFPWLINLRNLLQVAVSADPRYGPIYNLGVARGIGDALLKRGYDPAQRAPIILAGWSGGAQIAVGATSYLAALLNSPIYLVSIGGVMADDPGLAHASKLYHFYGTQDAVQALGGLLYLGRWSFMKRSPWNRALAGGKISTQALGAFGHTGSNNYFGKRSLTPGAPPPFQATLDAIATVVQQAEQGDRAYDSPA